MTRQRVLKIIGWLMFYTIWFMLIFGVYEYYIYLKSLEQQICDLELSNSLLNDENEFLETKVNELRVENMQLKDELVSVDTTLATYAGVFSTSAYCACSICTPGTGITASGYRVMPGITIAADPNVFPIGSYIYIEDIGPRIVHDTGSAIKGNKLDIYFENHEDAVKWGRRNKKIWKLN